MEPDDNGSDVVITYMFIKNGRWKIRTKIIRHDEISSYQKFRILNTMTSDEYYACRDK